ncbi:MAG: thioredoxin domain-containing protein [Acidimicrobiia bacterium]|nr:thioredoxin domain-containing protein [Acidimicrobiia bacterium]
MLAGLLALALLLAACGGDTTTATLDPDAPVVASRDNEDPDCVAAGTCTTEAGEDPSDGTEPIASEPADTYDGLAVGFNEDGLPYLGDPDAPVTLVEYSDYLCPFCGRHFTQTTPQLIDRYVRTGQINLVFHDFPLADLHPTAPAGHAAALCVSEQGAALFWAYHDELFARQGEWSSVPDNREFLAAVAGEIGADVEAYQACVDSGRTVPVVDERVAQGRALGFSGTPSFHIVDNRTDEIFEIVGAQSVETFASALDATIAGEAPVVADEPPPETPNLPFWANGDGLVPDPRRSGYTLAGDAFKGNPDAEVVVIEISDFQCPFCGRHALETQPALDEMYVDTGRVMWVFKHLPLQIHPQAPVAAAAAECAGEQGEFWAMHDLIFESVEEWAVDPPDPVLESLAGELGLDEAAFSACLGSRDSLDPVLEDLYDLTSVFSTTPTFVVLFDGQASVIEGAQPLEQFVSALEALLGE